MPVDARAADGGGGRGGKGTAELKKPPWLKKRLPRAKAMRDMDHLLRSRNLHTVCEGARCPNRGECFEQGTATFLILGGTCTRNCRFCSVPGGAVGPPDPDEPRQVADAAALLGLRFVVITSVTRDDLPDGGAGHFVATIREVRRRLPGAGVEVLVPDFKGSPEAVDAVLDEVPEVFNHNVETVPRLYPAVRPQAVYRRSLEVLRRAAADGRSIVKTGLMVGLGETGDEVRAVMDDITQIGVRVATIGQYLRPGPELLPVVEYVEPAVFEEYREYGESLGLRVEAAPFVRSSYHAEEGFVRVGRDPNQNKEGEGC
ncbi:MAG: lipoyl synthase [Thermoleophilia bacterium]